ncbi:peptidoglycan editing factor PgeF [Bacillus sp. REN16]|uniref:peptidoglycan editing factor PgeF n=1 Tax=Bacillus sp. REN16 TaxID=2887296 RepID=UPI001E31DE9B|nr:peptidoglycan editing factor PgeF [Bacillus sp. REN16]MCC3357551.1 peptidoglycan editing factor PgeF [Bacillus sp. REN16]
MKLEPFIQDTEQVLKVTSWSKFSDKLVVGFTTKNGGESKGEFESLNLGLHLYDQDTLVRSNRKQLADILDFPPENWVCSEQTHKNKIAKVSKNDLGAGVFTYEEGIKDTDGLFTNEKNILLTLCFADCVPLYFFTPSKQIIGIAHAGWKGTVQDIAGEMVRAWGTEDVKPDEIQAIIGPSIGQCCYIVDDYVINYVKGLDNINSASYEKMADNKYRLELKQLNYQLMVRAGIPPENIQVSSYCTSCENQLFFSHRRDAGKTGRMMSFIGFKED